jgi:short-subunit dehydrogenase
LARHFAWIILWAHQLQVWRGVKGFTVSYAMDRVDLHWLLGDFISLRLECLKEVFMKIQGSNFVITGGNRGIGLAVAEVAAAAGAHLTIASRTRNPGLESHLQSFGAPSARFIEADLASREGVEALANTLKELPVDILFNNAGLLTGGLIEDQALDDIYSMFQVNLNALVHLSRAVVPGMVERGRGKIINNSSVSAFMHFPCASTYAASKAAIVAFTDCLEVELSRTGVSTLCLITPGIKTRMFDEIQTKYSKNFEVPKDSISTEDYAKRVRAAIESDQRYLTPNGATGAGLWIARYLSPVFRSVVKSKFWR